MNESEFRIACQDYLSACGIYDLRAYGRYIGLKEPTKLKKSELVEEIVSVLSGQSVSERSKRGAPVKNDFFDPKILETIENLKLKYVRVEDEFKEVTLEDRISKYNNAGPSYLTLHDSGVKEDATERYDPEESDIFVYCGQLTFMSNGAYLCPLNCRLGKEKKVRIPVEFIQKYALRDGDMVSCHLKKASGESIAANVLMIDDAYPQMLKRSNFEENEVCFPSEAFRFYDGNHSVSVTSKYLEWLLPVKKGQRGCILASPKAGKSKLLYQITEATKRLNTDVDVFALLIDQSPEMITQYRRIVPEDRLVYSTYEDSADYRIFAAEFLLKRAKRFAEIGRHVLLVVDSLNLLAQAYNETEESVGGKVLAGGLESKTVQYLKKYFGTARCFARGGSLTILGTLSENTGNPADDILVSHLSQVANLEIRLSEELAIQRVYPTIDLLGSRMTENEEDASEVDGFLRSEYLPVHGERKLREVLKNVQTYEALKKAILANKKTK